MKKQVKERNTYIDIVKAILIILVIIGHSIQYGSGSNFIKKELFFNNYLFKFIYSFHMPLFIMISGYLSYNSINKNKIKDVFKSKISTLLIPILIWTIPVLLFKINEVTTIREFIKLSIKTFSTNLWFLWSVFYINILVKIINKYFKDNYLVYILVFLITFILPNELIIKQFTFQFSLYNYMYFYFIIGYLSKKHNIIEKINKYINNKTLIVNSILFILLLLFMNKHTYIYTSGMNILSNYKQLIIDLYRFLLGLIGSTEVLLLINILQNKLNDNIKNRLIYLGKNTLGIYIISSIIHPFILPLITKNLSNINYLFILLESIIILVISITAIELIKKNKYTNKFLLGEK